MSHNNSGKKFNVFDLFRDLTKFYGILYMLVLAFIVFLGAKYVKTLDYNKLFYAKELLAADTNMRVTLPLKKGSITPPVDVAKLSIPTPELLAKGKDIYNTTCASCHGETGAGNGPAGAALNPPPRNFVNPQPWKNGPKISQMYITLQEGIPNTGMASFSTIPPEDRFAVIQYVHTFNLSYPKDTPEDLALLDQKYSLKNGVKMANQIPLGLAMDLEMLDFDTLKADLNNAVQKLDNDIKDKKDTAVIMLNEIMINKNKALTSLASNTKWNVTAEEFSKFIGTDPLDKGFKASVYQLSPEKLNQIYAYLKNLFVKSRA
ncbi:MAG: cytochrome c [Bacteroidetes bacterium]|nr:cytochrome c [Bacteroidota bacterium]